MPGNTFGGGGFSLDSAEEVDLDSFLSSDPDKVEVITEKKDTTPDSKKPVPKKEGNESEEPTPAPNPQYRLEADDILGDATDEDSELGNKDEDDKLEGLDPLTPKKKEVKKEEPAEESTFALLTKELLTLGVFTPDEDEDGNEVLPVVSTPEEFKDVFQSEIKKQTSQSIQKFLERFGDEYAEMFDAVYVNGVPPYEYIARQAKIENIEAFDITEEDNQEKIVRQWYKTQGRPQERIEATIVKLKNYGDLEEEAKEAKQVLVTKEQTDLTNLAQQKQQEITTKNKIKQDYMTNVKKIVSEKLQAKDFDGIPIDRKFALETLDYLTKDVYQTKDKQLLTEFDKDVLDLNRPENNPLKVKVAMLLKMLKADPTLSKLGKRAVSKESNKLFAQLEAKAGKSNLPPQKKEDSPQYSW
jgi:hypothetical protein